MKLHFPPGNIIGGVNCIFMKKSQNIYKCKFEIQGYAINREKWKTLDKKYPKIINEIKKKLFLFYFQKVRNPIFYFNVSFTKPKYLILLNYLS